MYESFSFSENSSCFNAIFILLSSLLNAIPGLGLGDLITILLENALPVGNLIPTGYKNVTIHNCHVDGLTGTIGNTDKNFAGGFAGQLVGTKVFDCSVKNSTYTVNTKEYGGGFAGTIQAFVPQKDTESYIALMESVFGEGCCYVLSIRECGGTEIC